MAHILDVNDRAWLALKNKTKKIEIRATTNKDEFDYGKLMINDLIIFTNSKNEKIDFQIKEINWYKSIEELLIMEGTRYTLSSTNDFDEGVKSINSLTGYRDAICKNGVYAIHVEALFK